MPHSRSIHRDSITITAFALLSLSSFSTATSYDDNHALVRRQIRVSNDLLGCLGYTNALGDYPAEGGEITTKSQNTNYNYTPAIIMQPNSTEQVSDLVKCVAAQNGTVKASTFGGGHGE